MRADVRPGAPDREFERGLHGQARLNGEIVKHAVYADTDAGIVGHWVENDDGSVKIVNGQPVLVEARGVVEIVMPDGWKSSFPPE